MATETTMEKTGFIGEAEIDTGGGLIGIEEVRVRGAI